MHLNRYLNFLPYFLRNNNFLLNKINLLISNKIIKPEKSNNSYNNSYNNNDNNNNDKNNNKPIKKERNPGIDLVRLLTQYFIVVIHFINHGSAFKYFRKYERILRLIQSFIDWHNDAFILISGIVGYKTNKYSNLLYLWLMVTFYSVGIPKYVLQYEKRFQVRQDINKLNYPMIFQVYWYFSTYFGMYLFLPVINKGIAQLSKYEFRLVVMSTLGILVLWKDYKNKKTDVFHLNSGGSVIWFLIFYLTGAYIGKYRVDYNGFKKFVYCLICATIFTIASYLYFKIHIGEYYFLIMNKRIEIPIFFRHMFSESYNSLLKIIQTITVCLFFMQIHYNKYIAKFICFFGPLAFAIYLIYSNNILIDNVIRKFFINQPRNIDIKSLLSKLTKESLRICITCLIIDYFRNLLFSFLRIKKILLIIETEMKEKFS